MRVSLCLNLKMSSCVGATRVCVPLLAPYTAPLA